LAVVRIKTCTRTVACKLEVDGSTDNLLRRTMAAFNAAAAFCARVAWANNIRDTTKLHKQVYKKTREKFGLNAQLAVCARNKGLAAVRGSRTRKGSMPVFDLDGGVSYDSRSYSLKELEEASLSTIEGRRNCRLMLGDFQLRRLQDRSWRLGSAALVRRGQSWYLLITQTREQPAERQVRGVLAVSLDPERIASTSKGVILDTSSIQQRRRRIADHKRQLKHRNTRRSRWRLRQVRSRELRFQRDVNHRISKTLISQAIRERKALSVPRPSSVAAREPADSNTAQMEQSWAFFQLVRHIFYKARLAGVPTIIAPLEDKST
jgi:putative transposase